MELGSIFEAEDPPAKNRGPDIRVKVEVPPDALGQPDGYEVQIPLESVIDGQPVRRVVSPHDRGDRVRIYLPDRFPPGATLKLRGQGGTTEGSTPGDLHVQVEIITALATRPSKLPWLLAAAAAAAATASYFLL